MSKHNSVATKENGYADSSKLKVLDIVSKLEPSLGPSHTHWWKLTSPQLALMLEAADYPIEKQFETLLFYYHWVVSPESSPGWHQALPNRAGPLSRPQTRRGWQLQVEISRLGCWYPP